MADNFGKQGPGEAGRDRAEPSLREEVSRPSRRDPRADPDDDPLPAFARVDVFTVDRGSRPESAPPVDPLGSAALTLRRELAKLHQQAAAVERTIEDQRRERSEALERSDAATARVLELEGQIELVESETAAARRLHEGALADLQTVRGERDDLLRAVESAKATAEELSRTRAELENIHEAHDAVVRAASKYEAELAEIRKREQAGAQKVSDTETELASFRERLERTNAEVSQLRDEAAQSKGEIVQLKQEAVSTAEAQTKARDEAERELAASKEQVERLERSLAEARVAEKKLSVAETDLTAARRDATEARSEIARLERDLDVARHARDVGIERATMAERETEGIRKDVERLQRELEASTAATGRAEARTTAAERARASTEESVRQLRDEVTSAFARWKTISPSVAPAAGAAAPPTRAVGSIDRKPSPDGESPPTRRGGATPSQPVKTETLGGRLPPAAALPAEAVEDGWSAPPPPPPLSLPQPPAAGVPTAVESDPGPSRAPPSMRSRSKPAPVSPQRRSSPSIPPAVYPSVPPPASGESISTSPPPSLSGREKARISPPKPQLTDQERGGRRLPSIAPLGTGGTNGPRASTSAPPAPAESRPVATASGSTATAAASGSTASGSTATATEATATAATGTTQPSVAKPPLPPQRTEDAEAAPPAKEAAPADEPSPAAGLVEDREQLLERLADPDTAGPAATLLCKHPEWLKGRPPVEIVIALTCLDYDVEAPIFELARAWAREPMCRAVIAALRDEPDAKLREHGAWLLKHLGSPAALAAISELARNEAELAPVRRWLLEAIERLVVSHPIGWREVGDLVTTLARHADATIRDGVVGIVAALERSDEKRRILLELLRTDDNEVVLASAVHALASVLPIELDPAVAERLLGHPSPRVQRSVMDFVERSKRAARN